MDYWWSQYARSIPRRRFGQWRVRDINLTAEELERAGDKAVRFDGELIGREKPGTYTVLQVLSGSKFKTMMSDTMTEVGDHLPFIQSARGHVLVTGLGLGIVTYGLSLSKDVESVTVIEKSDSILELIGPMFINNDKVRIVKANAFTWIPDRVFDYAWHDLWLLYGPSNVVEMTKLKQHYSKYVANKQECWLEEVCNLMAFVKTTDRGPKFEEAINRAKKWYSRRKKAVKLATQSDVVLNPG